MTRLEAKWASKNIDVRPYSNGFMGNTVEDMTVLKTLTKFGSYPWEQYDLILAALGRHGFSITVTE